MRAPKVETASRPQRAVWLIPNLITAAALCCGLTALRLGIEGAFDRAILMICLAGLLDGLDGRIARRLGVTSRFGAELDNLSDFLCFGVAPAVVLYQWVLKELGGFGWALAVVFVLCCALRLARFLARPDPADVQPWAQRYFRGLPSPAAAAAALAPLAAGLAWWPEDPVAPVTVGGWMLGIALLMISPLPAFSLKLLRPRGRMLAVTVVLAALTALGFLLAPFATLVLGIGLYLASLPVSLWHWDRQRRRHRVPGA